ncbi:hypothetical protein CVT24_002163 [Panaeolus cyanescens]|uniref:Uncharacterized protein n=1 Tax=Panaeolus cyanescens TaxID=181874 RepID=A0A409YHU5_9AGAR|nr:hypothetical protein CVT24_002163 [Panaeolus cyanescens]
MWDTLRPDKRAAAEERFDRLTADHWGEWSEHGSKSLKFENTFESAIAILNTVGESVSKYRTRVAVNGIPKAEGYGFAKTRTGMLPVEKLLCERISLLHQQCQVIDDDLRSSSNQENAELIQILTKERKNALELLEKFTSELEKYTLEKQRELASGMSSRTIASVQNPLPSPSPLPHRLGRPDTAQSPSPIPTSPEPHGEEHQSNNMPSQLPKQALFAKFKQWLKSYLRRPFKKTF